MKPSSRLCSIKREVYSSDDENEIPNHDAHDEIDSPSLLSVKNEPVCEVSNNKMNVSDNSFVSNERANKPKKKKYKQKMIKCVGCRNQKLHYGKRMCKNCYNRTRTQSAKLDTTKHKICIECGKSKFIVAREACKNCYYRTRTQSVKLDTSKHRICVKCDERKFIMAREMCSACYAKVFDAPRIKANQLDTSKHRICVECNKSKLTKAHGMCYACYNRALKKSLQLDKSKHRTCVECNERKFIVARGTCKNCYHKIFASSKAKKLKTKNQPKLNHTSKLIPKVEMSAGDEYIDTKNGIKCEPSTSKQ